jgi:hypothetical protein
MYDENNMSGNLFTITLNKVVGSGTYTFSNLSDANGIDVCRDFLLLDVDLTSNDVLGGEYLLTLSNATEDIYSVICDVKDYEYVNTVSGNELYSSTVKINNL